MAALIVDKVRPVGSRSRFAIAGAFLASLALGSSAGATERTHVVIGIETDQSKSHIDVSEGALVSELRDFFTRQGWRVEGARANDRATANVLVRALVESDAPRRSRSCLTGAPQHPPIELRLKLTASAGEVLIAEARDVFVVKGWRAPNGRSVIPREWIQKVAAALDASGALSAHDARLVRSEEERRVLEAKAIHEAMELVWAETSSADCGKGVEGACSGVREYLNRFPQGSRAEEAKRLLAGEECRRFLLRATALPLTPETAARVLQAFETAKEVCGADWTSESEKARQLAFDTARRHLDEDQWKAAGAGQCRSPVASSDCDAVSEYANVWSAGAHASEARTLLAASAAKIAALKRKEQADRDEAVRRERIASITAELCRVLNRIDQVEAADTLRRRIDAASGTENLEEKRRSAASKILLGDRRDALLGEIKEQRGAFDRKRDCRAAQ